MSAGASAGQVRRGPIVFVDAHYRSTRTDATVQTTAQIGVVWADSWIAEEPAGETILHLSDIRDYEPGAFYRRELPCLLKACAAVESMTGGPLGGVVVDGNVRLDQQGNAGLGLHLYRAADQRFAVIGVAKRSFTGLTATSVTRGRSANPLWVTAAGMAESDAADLVASMAGPHRIPTLIKRADQLSRQ